MQIAAIVLSLLLAVAMLGSGIAKLAKAPNVVQSMGAVGVSLPQMNVLAVLEIAATVGLVAGLWVPALAIAAAIGAVVYFAGAVVAHLRAHDRDLVGALVLLALSVATLIVLLLR